MDQIDFFFFQLGLWVLSSWQCSLCMSSLRCSLESSLIGVDPGTFRHSSCLLLIRHLWTRHPRLARLCLPEKSEAHWMNKSSAHAQ